MPMNSGVFVFGVADEFSDWFRFLGITTVPMTAAAQFSDKARD